MKKSFLYVIKNIQGTNGVEIMGDANEVKVFYGLLSWREIIDYKLILNSNGKAITDEDFKKDEQKPSGSYDLSVGDRHFLFQPDGNWKPVFLGDSNALKKANSGIDASFHLQSSDNGPEKLVIPPFCSAIIELKETVDLYSVAKKEGLMIAGRFDLKLKAIYKGLISQQATQVEPCYRGKLYCFVHNLGKKEITLEKDSKVATIEFSYVGQSKDKETRDTIIDRTIDYNSREKYGKNTRFSAFVCEQGKKIYTGIGDIRWLKDVDRLPEQCGIAPIYNMVTGKINDQVDTHLEKSSTIESITNRVSNRIKEKENILRIVLSLVLAIITFFTTNLVREVRAELRYFSEELTFFSEKYASLIALGESNETPPDNGEGEDSNYVDHSTSGTSNNTTAPVGTDAPDSTNATKSAFAPDSADDSGGSDIINSLEALKNHTQELSQVRTTFWKTTVIALLVIAVLLFLLFFFAFGPSGEQKWIRKRKILEAKHEYFATEQRIANDNSAELKRCCKFKK